MLFRSLPWENFYSYLRDQWKRLYDHLKPKTDFEAFWTSALQRGGLFQPKGPKSVRLNPGVLRRRFESPTVGDNADRLTLIAYPSATFYDGRMANRPWLQELPDALTQIVWDSWIEINPNDAKRLGLSEADLLVVQSSAGRIDLPEIGRAHV